MAKYYTFVLNLHRVCEVENLLSRSLVNVCVCVCTWGEGTGVVLCVCFSLYLACSCIYTQYSVKQRVSEWPLILQSA